jgi:hypothetical protein
VRPLRQEARLADRLVAEEDELDLRDLAHATDRKAPKKPREMKSG